MPLQIKMKKKMPRGLNVFRTFFFLEGGGGYNKRKVDLNHIPSLPVTFFIRRLVTYSLVLHAILIKRGHQVP